MALMMSVAALRSAFQSRVRVCHSPAIVRMCSSPATGRSPKDWPLVTSSANQRLKTIKRLHTRRQRERLGLVLLEGHRLVLDAFEAGLVPEFVVIDDTALDRAVEGPRLRTALSSAACDVVRVREDAIVDLSDTITPQGVLAVLPQITCPLPPRPSLVLVCDAISDPGNLGTLLRSAAGAGVEAALLTPGCSDPWGLKALRAGMGAQLRLPLHATTSWAETSTQLSTWGVSPLAADAGGSMAHYEVDWSKPSALVVGSEAHGLSEAVRTDPAVHLCRIPLGDPVSGNGIESLNAAVAGSVIMFEAMRQRLLR